MEKRTVTKDHMKEVATLTFQDLFGCLDLVLHRLDLVGVPPVLGVELIGLAIEEVAYLFSQGPAAPLTEDDEKLLEHAARVMHNIGEKVLNYAREELARRG